MPQFLLSVETEFFGQVVRVCFNPEDYTIRVAGQLAIVPTMVQIRNIAARRTSDRPISSTVASSGEPYGDYYHVDPGYFMPTLSDMEEDIGEKLFASNTKVRFVPALGRTGSKMDYVKSPDQGVFPPDFDKEELLEVLSTEPSLARLVGHFVRGDDPRVYQEGYNPLGQNPILMSDNEDDGFFHLESPPIIAGQYRPAPPHRPQTLPF